MAAKDFVALIHFVGFITGIALYGMLAVMTWRTARREGAGPKPMLRIPVLAAVLGIIWNAGELLVFGWRDFGLGDLNPWLNTLSYAALGFLPAVVVDSATRAPHAGARPSRLALLAYALSAAAAIEQALATRTTGTVTSPGLITLTLGYAVILLALVLMSRRRTGSQRTITAVALAAFAVSALHLSHHSGANDSWVVELIGHHASLPLVLVILYQDYRFALADLFLKRAISGMALVTMVVGVYALLWAPLGRNGARILPAGEPTVLLAAWIATALLYPRLRSRVDRFVDRVILRRSDYVDARAEIAAQLAGAESAEQALDVAAERVRVALTADRASWSVLEHADRHGDVGTLVTVEASGGIAVRIPTTDSPGYVVNMRGLASGRRLMSDDVALLDNVAMLVARRVDELRLARERVERDVREHEMQRLAAEAELRALRAQLNPHFLFNALTTIGYLIRTSPPKALDTLMQLTALLRAVLRRATGDFVTLAEEMQIVDAYLAIEQTRFEDRLAIERSVPVELNELSVPPLLVQPIVENAIKHGIAPRRQGGLVRIEGSLDELTAGGHHRSLLHLRVTDTGAGVDPSDLARRRATGVGLANVERRLNRYFGPDGRLEIQSVPGRGTVVDIFIPTGT